MLVLTFVGTPREDLHTFGVIGPIKDAANFHSAPRIEAEAAQRKLRQAFEHDGRISSDQGILWAGPTDQCVLRGMRTASCSIFMLAVESTRGGD